MKILGLSLDAETNITRRFQIRHAVIGASYGLIGGTAFALAAAFADLLLYQDLPLGANYASLGLYWLIAGLGLAVIGFATCWAVETWKGLLIGSVTAGILALIGSLVQSPVGIGTRLMVIFFILMPVVAFVLPLAWLLRWLAEGHERARSSMVKILLLVVIAILIGSAGGYFMKMPARAVSAIRFVHGLIQESTGNEKSILRKIPGFTDHINSAYKIYESPSEVSTEGFVVKATYDDGYELSCDVVMYPGRDPFLSLCTASSQH